MRSGLIDESEAVLVLGSLNAKPQDRELDRTQIHPVQALTSGGLEPIGLFDNWGRLGVSSLAWHPDRPTIQFVATGEALFRLDIDRKEVSPIEVPDLKDIHELTVVGDTVWIANTGNDEAIAVDMETGQLRRRLSLAKIRSEVVVQAHDDPTPDEAVELVDRFHCNQIFEGFDGLLYGLVHHVTGKQIIRKIAEKLIKSHGNGGLICLDTGRPVPLGLKGPHTVRTVGEHYWLFDSGGASIRVYDADWQPVETVRTRGWGRGGWLSGDSKRFYAGISETRKRYRNLPGARYNPNLVEVLDTASHDRIGEVVIGSGLEQINNLYVLPAELVSRLESW